jgi:hypothetical protein
MAMVWRLYYVPFEKLSDFFGCKNPDLLKQVLMGVKESIHQNHELLEKSLTEISTGQCIKERAFEYAQGLEYLCKFYGVSVPQEGNNACRWDWIDEVEVILPLITSGAPIPIPVREIPLVGHLTPEQIAQTIKTLERYDTDDIVQPKENESSEILAFRCCYTSWLKEARQGEGIVSFLW